MSARAAAAPMPLRRLGIRRPFDRLLAVGALGLAAAIWGTSFVASKAVLAEIPPITQAALRCAVALLVLWPLARRGGDRPARGAQPALLGLTGIVFLIAFQNVGLRLTGAADAALIVSGGVPVLATLLGVLVLGERPSGGAVVGLVASIAGVVLVVMTGASGGVGGSASLVGDLLILASAASVAVYLVAGRRAFAEGRQVAVVAGSTAYALLFLAPASVVELAFVGGGLPSFGALALLLYLGAGCSALAYVLCGYGLRHLTAAENAAVSNLEVVVGVVVAALVFGEPVGVGQLGGIAFILTGAASAARGEAASSGKRSLLRRIGLTFVRHLGRRGACPYQECSVG